MSTSRKTYTDEFKNKAVLRCKTEALPDVAKDLGINESMLYTWRSKATGTRKKKSPPVKKSSSSPSPVSKVNVHDAIVYLRKARGMQDLELARSLADLALGALEGKL